MSGRRERKKHAMRQHIANVARTLVVERGFEAVTVAEIARAAGVAEKTVFNYFPRKEDLVYSGLELFGEQLLEAVGDRAAGESVLTAFRRLVLVPSGLLEQRGPQAEASLRALHRTIADSPALLAREQQAFARHTDALAALLAAQERTRPGNVEPWVVANALVGVQRALVGEVRRRVLAGESNDRIARAVRAQARRAFAALERGLGDYGVRR